MPIITIKTSAPRTADLSAAIAAMVLDATSAILGKKRELTSIAIGYVDPQDWFVGGQPLSAQQCHSVYLDIKVTDETNTKDEKARYLRAVYDGFARLIGPLHDESYIHVHDVRAAAYGYGGLTQEYRYHHPDRREAPVS